MTCVIYYPMTDKWKIKNGYVDQNLIFKWNSLTASNVFDIKYKESIDSKLVRKYDRRYFNLKNDKDKNIIVVQYKMAIFVHLIAKYHKYKYK